MASFAGPNITNNNLAFNLDAGNVKSYPGSGATWNDLAGTEIHGTVNSATYTDNAHGKYFAFDGTDDYISFAMGGGDPEQLKLHTWSTECWFQWHSGGSTAGTGGGGIVVEGHRWDWGSPSCLRGRTGTGILWLVVTRSSSRYNMATALALIVASTAARVLSRVLPSVKRAKAWRPKW